MNFVASVFCAVVVWNTTQPVGPNPATWLLDKNVTLKEGEETELLRTESAVYTAYLEQHDKKYDPKHSALFLTIKQLDTGKNIGNASAFWVRQPAHGKMSGLVRLMTETDGAEPGLHTQFFCDNRLVKGK